MILFELKFWPVWDLEIKIKSQAALFSQDQKFEPDRADGKNSNTEPDRAVNYRHALQIALPMEFFE